MVSNLLPRESLLKPIGKSRLITVYRTLFLLLPLFIIIRFSVSAEEIPVETLLPQELPYVREDAVPQEKPFTAPGQGTVVDNAFSGDGKEFITITTEHENTFYPIIDRQRDAENVYFLRPVTEDDLMDFVAAPIAYEPPSGSALNMPIFPTKPIALDEDDSSSKEPDTPPLVLPKPTIDYQTIITYALLGVLIVAGGVMVFLRIRNNKNAKANTAVYEYSDDEEGDNNVGSDDDEDYEP